MDNTEHLLRTSAELEAFKQRMGKMLSPAMGSVSRYIAGLPNGAWIDYLKGVPAKNIPKIIGCICIYIQECDCKVLDIDFNKNATMIRVRRYAWSKVNNSHDEKLGKKMQNNGGSGQ